MEANGREPAAAKNPATIELEPGHGQASGEDGTQAKVHNPKHFVKFAKHLLLPLSVVASTCYLAYFPLVGEVLNKTVEQEKLSIQGTGFRNLCILLNMAAIFSTLGMSLCLFLYLRGEGLEQDRGQTVKEEIINFTYNSVYMLILGAFSSLAVVAPSKPGMICALLILASLHYWAFVYGFHLGWKKWSKTAVASWFIHSGIRFAFALFAVLLVTQFTSEREKSTIQ